MDFEVIFDSRDFLVINKLNACSYHSDQGVGLFDKVKAVFPSLISVHRLDKPTIGLCLFAKNENAAKQFGELFSKKLIHKIYLAVSDKKPRKKQGLILGDMEKGRGGSYRLCKTKLNPSITQFFSRSISPGKRIFILKPLTGKTHQLRVMMKSVGAPILGDTRYKGSDSRSLYLQAHHLKFEFDGESYNFELNSFLDISNDFISSLDLKSIIWPDLKKNL